MVPLTCMPIKCGSVYLSKRFVPECTENTAVAGEKAKDADKGNSRLL